MNYAYQIDTNSGQHIIIQYPHHEIHNGNAYFIAYSALAAKDDFIEVRIEVSASVKAPHMIIIVEGAVACTAELFMGTTKTDVPGNRLTPFNRNQNSSNTSGLIICHTPGGAQAGTGDLIQYLGSSDVGGVSTVGGAATSRSEFILKKGINYLLRNTSRSNNNAISIILDWYEPESYP